MVSRKDNPSGSVGKSILRFDGPEKVNGTALYVDDVKIKDCWHGIVVRSPLSHCILKGTKLDSDYDWSKVVVVTKDDIKGTNLFDMHDELMPVLGRQVDRSSGSTPRGDGSGPMNGIIAQRCG